MAKYCSVVFPLSTRQVFSYQTGEFSEIIKIGQRVSVPFGRREGTGFVVELSDQLPDVPNLKTVSRLIDAQPLVSDKVLTLAKWMADYYCASLGEILRFVLTASVRPPKREPIEEEVFYQGILTGVAQQVATPEQKKVLEDLKVLLTASEKRAVLLQGVAASGKTEIYLQLAAFAADAGGQALILVPEVVLVPQTEEWARERFGDRVAVLHGRLTPAEHYRLLCKAKEGKVSVLIGTRSALFASLPDLRLIVLDEEFDRSYKETRNPRYHARDVAIKRGEIEGALVVLGSATPSLEVYQAAKEGRYAFFSLKERIVKNLFFPEIHIADLRLSGTVAQKRRRPIISSTLRALLEERLLKGEQSIIFINRRGHSTYLFCEDCGYLFACPECAVTLVYHHTTGELYCHYCGYRKDQPQDCPACNHSRLGRSGMGTQLVEKELNRLFPDNRILRLDSDALNRKEGLDSVLAFRDGKYQIMVGTQLVTKGHHFPLVTLVGVLGSDVLLNLPDFRAAERSFQLLCQSAGRAGRNLPNAEVYIQTYYPDHYVFSSLPGFKFEEFYEKELFFRKEAGYPPFGYLANILFTGKREETVLRKSGEWAELANRMSGEMEIEVLGPAACFHKKMRQSYRRHLILKSAKPGRIQEFLRSLPDKQIFDKGVTIDIDPVDLF